MNLCNEVGLTPCHIASENGHLDIVQLLVERGTDVNVLTGDHYTTLALASGSGAVEVSHFLIDRGADVNSRIRHGWTPCHMASITGELNIIRLLIKHGTDVDARTEDDFTPLVLASAQGMVEVSRFLINSKNSNGSTLLHTAAGKGYLEVLKFLSIGARTSTCVTTMITLLRI